MPNFNKTPPGCPSDAELQRDTLGTSPCPRAARCGKCTPLSLQLTSLGSWLHGMLWVIFMVVYSRGLIGQLAVT